MLLFFFLIFKKTIEAALKSPPCVVRCKELTEVFDSLPVEVRPADLYNVLYVSVSSSVCAFVDEKDKERVCVRACVCARACACVTMKRKCQMYGMVSTTSDTGDTSSNFQQAQRKEKYSKSKRPISSVDHCPHRRKKCVCVCVCVRACTRVHACVDVCASHLSPVYLCIIHVYIS